MHGMIELPYVTIQMFVYAILQTEHSEQDFRGNCAGNWDQLGYISV